MNAISVNDDQMDSAGDVSNVCHKDEIHIENEMTQEIKSEPLDKLVEVHDGSNDDVIKRASNYSNIYFDHEDTISVKKEIKQEIITEPLDKVVEVHFGSNDDVIKRASDLAEDNLDQGISLKSFLFCEETFSNFRGKSSIGFVKPKSSEKKEKKSNRAEEKKKSHEIKSSNGFVKPKSSEKKVKKSKHAAEKKKSLEKQNICETCFKSFATPHTLQKHIEMVHEGLKRFQCNICEISFTTKQCLVRHQDNFLGNCLGKAKNTNNFSDKHKCDICGKSFFEARNVRNHKKSVHEGIKDFHCDVCEKLFATKQTLQRHQKRCS